MTEVDLNIYRGQTFERNILIDCTLDITELYFTMKKDVEQDGYTLQKTIGNGLTLKENKDGVYKYLLAIEPSDTEELDYDEYGYDITMKSNDIKVPLVIGTVNILPVYTRKVDE